MVKKDYEDLEYFAQKFRDYLANPQMGGFRAIQRGEGVEFYILGIKCRVDFFYKGTDLYSTLEMKSAEKNSKLIEIPANIPNSVKIPVKVKKSKAGRVSGSYGEGFQEYFKWINDYLGDFYEKLNSK